MDHFILDRVELTISIRPGWRGYTVPTSLHVVVCSETGFDSTIKLLAKFYPILDSLCMIKIYNFGTYHMARAYSTLVISWGGGWTKVAIFGGGSRH